MEPGKLVDSINSSFGNYNVNWFRLRQSKDDAYYYVIEGRSLALNRFDTPQEFVKVIEWFDKFWLFLGIKFSLPVKKNSKRIDTQLQTISLSVFQGEDYDDKKYQLFRAEWDNYSNADNQHAQPHWHITSSQAIETIFDEYTNDSNMRDFLQILEDEKRKVIDVKRIHFAMNGNWQKEDDNHIHKMEDEEQVVRWLQGLLAHLRTELEAFDIKV